MPRPIYPIIVKRTTVQGGGGSFGGASSLDIRDSVGALTARVTQTETQTAQTETNLSTIRDIDTETQAAQTENLRVRPTSAAYNDTQAVQTHAQTMEVVYTASGTWTAPAGVTQATVELWGAGGGGAGGTALAAGAGGGGGAYTRTTLAVTPSTTYSFTVGTGGTAGAANGAGGIGGDTFFINASTALAKGGSAGAGTTGVNGGQAAAGVGTTKFSGGNSAAGGGGGGAGTTANGGNASGATGGTGGTQFGGNGGNTGVAGAIRGGGGGGGAASLILPDAGTVGARGEVMILWTTGN